MKRSIYRRRGTPRRRGLVVVQVMVLLTVLMGFTALTIDVGTLYQARADLQSAADSAALAAASSYANDSMYKVRLDSGDAASFAEVQALFDDRASTYSMLNDTLGDPTIVESGHVTSGWLDLSSATSTLDSSVASDQYNGVHVFVRKAGAAGGNSAIDFFFAPIFGELASGASASATAVLDDRFAGFDPNGGPGVLTPFTINETVYNSQIISGNDDYSFDDGADTVMSGGDGILEINLYPFNLTPGNFGLLNIGTPNQSTPALADQIENGVSASDIHAETGAEVMTFYDSGGNPVTYNITGNPGMKSALESSVELRVGDVIGFFLHNSAVAQGSNTVYTITKLRFGRVMDVQLNGNPNSRGIWIQPTVYAGAAIVLGANAPSSNGLVGRVVLAR